VSQRTLAKTTRRNSNTYSIAAGINLLGASLTPLPAATELSHPKRILGHIPGTPEAIDAAMDSLLRRLIPELQRYLDGLQRCSFTKEDSTQLAKALSRLARRLNCGYLCPHCGGIARSIRFSSVGRSGISVWKFEHSEIVRHGGSGQIGPLKLVVRPALRSGT
jgi:hypothetical protein